MRSTFVSAHARQRFTTVWSDRFDRHADRVASLSTGFIAGILFTTTALLAFVSSR